MKVDKAKWVKTTLGEVTSFFSGYTPAKEEISNEGVIPYFKVAEMNIPGNERYLVKTNLYVDANRRLFPENSIVFPKNGAAVSTNKKRILKQESVVDLNTSVVVASEPIYFKFVYYWFQSKDFNDFIRRGAIPTLNIGLLKNEIILFPTKYEQVQIVTELDAIQKMIDGYKAQIKDLDELAKSIFLDMFGDVSINEKDWETTKLEKLGKLKNGLNYDKVETGNKIKIVGVGDFQSLLLLNDFSKIRTIELQNVLPDDYTLRNGDIIFVRSNGNKKLVGRCMEVFPEEEVVTFGAFCIRFRKNNNSINNKYLIYLLTDKGFKNRHILKTNGIGIQSINQKILGGLPIPLPPLPLQQQFAAKVEGIEKQKELLRQQLSDAETLMAERMQYYFS